MVRGLVFAFSSIANAQAPFSNKEFSSAFEKSQIELELEQIGERNHPCYKAAIVSLTHSFAENYMTGPSKIVSLNIFQIRMGDFVTVTSIRESGKFRHVAHWLIPVKQVNKKTCLADVATLAPEDDLLGGGGGVSVHN